MTAQTAATIAQDFVEEFDEEQPATVVSLAAETLGRDLLQALLQEVRVLPDVWPKLTEKKQADVIDRLRSTVERTVKYAVKLISAGERPAIGGILESVAIKEGIKATFKVSQFDPLRHDLIDRAGKVCMLVVADAEEYLQGMDTVVPDPDQSAWPWTKATMATTPAALARRTRSTLKRSAMSSTHAGSASAGSSAT
ncbi:TPA: hypothetical protein ACGJZ0_003808 [Pseudomonas aeruginosa]|uniref:hypothetical protein n=1 Tax=Pseudomonas aeruginosa TaxID=287 RepID=UPI000A400B95|nr:hypothetical protein [Pseudomonas aeruginosa]